jgi:peptidoglycan/xylan/chitin deacetylase (PgdA/CDA1 family)
VTPFARRAVKGALRWPLVNHAARWLASARGHRLVLVYHRLAPPLRNGCGIIPSIPVDLFRAHLQLLGEIANLVSLDTILRMNGQLPAAADMARPAVAVTFDDDLSSHADEALPLLRGLGATATFFVSGRILHGMGAYWFQQLEAVLLAHGRERTATLLGLSGIGSGAELVITCERDESIRAAVAALAADLPAVGLLDSHGLTSLIRGGMTLGFHTLGHRILPDMTDRDLEEAVSRGREQLALLAGVPLRYFAYPYGRADVRAAAAVRRAGFDAAFTGRPEPLRPDSDHYRVGRWEPGALPIDDLIVGLAARLHSRPHG